MAVTLKGITEDNFIDAFNLKLKKDQKNLFLILSVVLHRRMFIVISVSRLEFMRMTGWSDM